MTATPARNPDPQGPTTPPETGRDGKDPFAREVAAYRIRLLRRVKEGDVEAVAGQLIRRARAGDPRAMRLFLLYVIDTPADRPAEL